MVGDESIKLKWRMSGSGWSATVGASILGLMSILIMILDGMECFYPACALRAQGPTVGGLLGLGPLKKTDITRRRKEQFGWDPCLNRLGLRTML